MIQDSTSWSLQKNPERIFSDVWFFSSLSEDEDDHSLGKIWFNARYDADDMRLDVEVLKGRILAGEFQNTHSDFWSLLRFKMVSL